MPNKITLAVLAEKIDNLHSVMDSYQEQIDCCKKDITENTSFRLQAKGFIAAFVMIAGVVGGIVAWVVNRVFK